ncbi:MAG: peroxiredoxin family protein [Bacillota bacterium]
MRKKVLIILFSIPLSLNAQKLSVDIKGSKSERAILYSLQGEKTLIVDTLKSSSTGRFEYWLDPDKLHRGFYRLEVSKASPVDFIYDNEAVSLKTDLSNSAESLQVVSSESNRLYYSFIRLNRLYKAKSELLQLILVRYPEEDDFYKNTVSKLKELQAEYQDFVNNRSQKKQKSFIAKYIRSAQLPVVTVKTPPEKQLIYLKSHALDKIDFSDSELIYSDLFTSKSIEYLSYYRNPQLSKEALEKEFMISVDSLLHRAKVSQMVYQQITEYLIEGFRKFGFDRTIDYILENYVIKDDLCLDPKIENSIERRIAQSKYLPLNSLAPEITLPDSSGEQKSLKEINSSNVLVVFYASWCPHCREIMPQLKGLYSRLKGKGIEVLAVSLDSKKEEWINFIKENGFEWADLSDLKGWESQAAADYHIYATPSMFLLNKERRILGKPTTIEELTELLRTLRL